MINQASGELRRYALVTPARNEAAHIARTLASVVAQARRPVRWVVVNDNSTDRTGEIIAEYAARYDFIVHVDAARENRANFGSKIKAFNAGYARLAGVDFDYVGVLDGDISFGPDYFERLLALMDQDPRLGLAGGLVFEEVDGKVTPQSISLNSVAGAVQLFRRECFEQIGGFRPLELGGEDSLTEIMARRNGWKVQTFPQLRVCHHGRVTMGGRNSYVTRFRKGMVNYTLGYHPLFQIAIGLYRMIHRPYLIGGLLLTAGYFWAELKGLKREAPRDVITHLRAEQLHRLGLRRCAPAPQAGAGTAAPGRVEEETGLCKR